MSYKENGNMSFYVKPEPRDGAIPPLNPFNGVPTGNIASSNVKQEEPQPVKTEVKHELPQQQDVPMMEAPRYESPEKVKYTVYKNVTDIAYTPEGALSEGLKMIESLQERINKLVLGSKMRQEVWKREIQNLKNQSTPTTLIAVCGATGAGKSSILNAVLDDNIVPTSGMRACTAVVTEISYHKKGTIDGDVSFLSEEEWRQELSVLLHDLTEEDGKVKRTTDLKSDAGIAWQKVHALYPAISIEELVKMTPDQIINYDQNLRNILGTTKKIVAKDSKQFGKEIAKYIDSKDQKRGDKKDKKKEKKKEKSVMDKVREAAGVADANAARNNIAKDYMKKANCIWILAPITRAVDDKTAKDLLGDAFKMQLMMDGNYDDHCITFIASKCDDISCSEVIHALQLHDDPELLDIEEHIDSVNDQIKEQKQKKSVAEKLVKGIEADMKDKRERLADHKNHLDALENGEPYTSKFAKKHTMSASKKRKNKRDGKQGPSKRRRSSAMSDEEDDEDDEEDDISSSSESESEASDSDESDSDSDESTASQNDSDDESAIEVEELIEPEEETEESLTAKISSLEDAIKETRKKLKEAKAEKSEAADRISVLEKQLTKVQKEKNAFCSKKRSEFSRDVLKEDFRTGLKELDDAAAEERDPDNFDPSVNLRDYAAIDLPVFTCSSRDYVRLKGQVKGDGEPSCFSNVRDTGIPDLQAWCHQLTIASRERGVRNFMTQLALFAKSVQSYVDGINDVTAADRALLQEKWESRGFNEPEEPPAPMPGNIWADLNNDPLQDVLGRLGAGIDDLYHMNKPEPKLDANGQPVGITPRLCMEFSALVDECVEDLKAKFKDNLEEKCKTGAAAASSAAIPLLDEFTASMHWSTFRATLRRHGAWRRDLNVELINPFTKSIAHSWGQLFESDLFGHFESSTMQSITNLLKEVEESAAPGLKDRTRLQGEACLEEAKAALQKTMTTIRETMNTEQKETSRLLSPHVQEQLRDGYDEAMTFTGKGSVARQKAYFRSFLDEIKDDIFDDGAGVLMDRLDQGAAAIGEALDEALGNLAQKIEVNLAVLWEGVRDDPAQVRARQHVVDVVSEVQTQVEMWLQAASLKKEAELPVDDDVDMD
ncbi:hypothetical protein CC1G_00242 [Coprinopsis cinerea okayama7|uniref:Nuclear GTPase SLIP-GC n=1 Tax=Coprinopsis cinerea (strain Okayama-7 / 130 / ATCC MYA-4618 / FGSC 9003) TaxID=240176 RepID=A8NX97_COPC7|nr:hypothetical protein CC1G_00242 [Coprinopsis cinerea okayama7\|eukprot:XP_001837106.2 hypothetical protein CC1G_00242 [Coprinopsis cinerea okayama7\